MIIAEWSPISTAPTEELFECLVASDVGQWVFLATFVSRKDGDGREGPGWVTWHGDVSPSHWMPKPSPPRRPAQAVHLPDQVVVVPDGVHGRDDLRKLIRS